MSSKPIPFSPPGSATLPAAAKRSAMSMRGTLALLALLVAPAAMAYRPFDNTDADTARQGQVELEVGPIGYTRVEGRGEYTPIVIANYGFAPDTEVVLEAIDHVLLGAQPPGATRFSISDVQLSVK